MSEDILGSLLSRRSAIKAAGIGALAFAVGGAGGGAGAATQEKTPPAQEGASGVYELPPLPYGFNALAPAIDETTLQTHYEKHHAAYVKGLNEALRKLEMARNSKDFAQVRALSRDLAFNGSGHVLHTLYWNSIRQGGSAEPQGALRTTLDRDFGSFDAFKAQFIAAAVQVEASGWGVLAWEPMGKRLMVLQAERHEDLTIWGATPLMVCDVWEHAYYLQYKNRRDEYVNNFWKIIDWQAAAKRFEAVAATPAETRKAAK